MDKPGAQEFYDSWIAQLAEWGVDFIKADDIVPYPREIEAIAKAIKKTGRPIILSLSPGNHIKDTDLPSLKQGNMLRITADIWDDKHGINQCFSAWIKWQNKAAPGFWMDMDMIPFGRLQLMSPPPSRADKNSRQNVALSGKGHTRTSRLTPNQMYTFITMRALAASPLMMGGELPGLDKFSLQLLTNSDMIACNQNGVMGKILLNQNGICIAKTPEQNTGHGWIGIFNRRNTPSNITLTSDLPGMPNLENFTLRDIWKNRMLHDGQELTIEPDGVLFIRYMKK